MLRPPAVAGQFYPAQPNVLRQQLQALWPSPPPEPQACVGAVVPHAGYVYSGRTAAQVYARLLAAPVYLLLGPNHTGAGAAVSLAPAGAWETPLGRVAIDEELSQALADNCPGARREPAAHAQEHSLEVQLPFLQWRQNTPFTMAAVALGTRDYARLEAVGLAAAQAIRGLSRPVIILASSDMNHFANVEQTRRLDHLALEPLLSLDPARLARVVQRHGISMCGVGPAVALLVAAQQLGAQTAKLVDYTTSAEASGDETQVVGYAGVIVI